MSFADYVDSIGGKPIHVGGRHYDPINQDWSVPTFPRPDVPYGATDYTQYDVYKNERQYPAYVDSGGGFLGWGDSVDDLRSVPQLATGYADWVIDSNIIEQQRLKNEQLRQQIASENQLAQQQYANSLPSVANLPSLVSPTVQPPLPAPVQPPLQQTVPAYVTNYFDTNFPTQPTQQIPMSTPQYKNQFPAVQSRSPVANMGGWGSQPTQQTGMLGGLHRGSHGGLGMLSGMSGGFHRGGK